MKPTIKDEHLIHDPMDDEVGELLKEMEKHRTLTKAWVSLKQAVIKNMSQGKKVRFTSDNRLFRLYCVGESLVCRVPKSKRGYLEKMRGRVIRLVCIGSIGRHLCEYIAAPLPGGNFEKNKKKEPASKQR